MKNKFVFRVCAAAVLLAALQGACFAQGTAERANVRPIVSASVVPLGVQPYAADEVTYSIDGMDRGNASLEQAIAAINASAATAGHITLQADITVAQPYVLTSNVPVTIEGNGHSLERADTYQGALLSVTNGNLTLNNVILDGGASMTAESDGSWTWGGISASEALIQAANATLTLSGTTTLRNAWNTQSGGGIFLDNSPLTIQDGAAIQACKSDANGGGIYAMGDVSVVTLRKTNISSCEASNGGGVCLENGARFTTNTSGVTDVKIVGNRAGNGGGIYAAGATGTSHSLNQIYMQGNQAQNGGAVYAADGAKFESKTSINHDIIENIALQNGGAFYIDKASEVNLRTTNLQRNEAQNGGAVYVSGKFIANVVQLKANQASYDGGAVYANAGATVDLKSGTVGYEDPDITNSGLLQNTAGRNGGAIYASGTGTQVTIGETSDVGIYDNKAGNMAGALYLTDGSVAMFPEDVDIRRNSGAENGAPVTPWEEETSCGGVRVDGTSTLKIAKTITITKNTVGTEGREVNLLIDTDEVAAGAGQNVPVECYWDGGAGGLSPGTEIGVSLKVWPMSSGSDEVLYMVGKAYSTSSDGITDDYADYFTSDRNPYDASTQKGFFETVVRSASHPDTGASNYNQVYLKAYPIQTPTVSVQAMSKYYDGTNAASLTDVTWLQVDDAVKTLFQGLKEGTDYTYTATFENAQGNVLFDGASVKEQNVQVTLVVQNQQILKVFPSLSSMTVTSKATIYPIPLAAAAQVQDKYYDATNAAQAAVSLAVDTNAGTQAGLTLPSTLPVVPAQDTDYTVTASFDSANAGPGKTAAVQVASKGTALAKNYIWPGAPVTASAEIFQLPLEISFEAENKAYDGSPAAVLKGTPTVKIAQQSRSGLTLPSSLPEAITFATDYTLESLMFVDANGQPVSDAGAYTVTGMLKSLNDSKMNNYIMALAAQGAQAEITQRTLSPVSVKVQDKLYDGTTEAAASDVVFSGLPDGETLEEGVDYRIVSALFEDAETGVDKQVRVTFELLSEKAKRNYLLEKDFLIAEADITNDLKVTDEHTEEVSSGVMTVQDMEAWIRAKYYHVPTTLVSLTIKDANGNTVQEIDRSIVAAYSVEALFTNDNGQTALYQIAWNLVEKQVEEPTVPEETPGTPEEKPTAPTQPPAASPIVQTGDSSSAELLALALAISATAIAVLMIAGHKRNNMKQK